jgi:3-oxoacyl-[acyl-carrier protein] reductase
LERVALVTGASRGIGRATGILLGKRGFKVAIHFRENRSKAEEVLREIGGRGKIFQADLTDPKEAVKLADQVLSEFGEVHILVNNAGVSTHYDLEELPLDEWERSLTIHLTSPFILVKKLAPSMKKAGWGRIVNISSLRAMTGSSKGPHYAASKAGIIGLTKSLALILSPYGITVNAVAPGYTRTDMTMQYLKEREKEISSQIPLRRVAEPEEVARVIAFLCSDDASYITGETILVNGGIYMD